MNMVRLVSPRCIARLRGVNPTPLPLREGLGEGLGVRTLLNFRFDNLASRSARPSPNPSLGGRGIREFRAGLLEPRANWPITLLLLILSVTLRAEDTTPAEPKVAKVEAFPAQVKLETASDRQSVVILATYEDGTTRDATGLAEFGFTEPGTAALEGHELVPVADGQTQLIIIFEGQALAVPVVVQGAAAPRPVSFKLDVMPVFMRAGCNSGSCHGSARGQDGFRLSLFGYDPDGDYFRITRQMSSRRLNLALADESLMMEKVLGRVPHSGGKRFEEGSFYDQTLMRWLDAGAPSDPADVAAPISIRIMPPLLVLEGEGATQQMTVLAEYSDGTDRDVTNLTVFLSNNETSAAVSPDGLVTTGQRGEAFVMARFATFTEGSQVIVIPADLDYTRPQLAENNTIDTLIHEKLHKLRILPSPLCSDEAFLRRAFIDIAGVLPTPNDWQTFRDSTDPNKREKLVDELLARKEFAEMWVMKWAELLRVGTNGSYKSTLLYFNWLQDKIANNVPFDRIVRQILAASGGTFTNPATNYYQTEGDTLKVAENVAQVFMGMRIQCAQCHNHPFDRWTQDDYYSFAAFFSQIGRKNAQDPRETIVYNKAGGEVTHPVGGRTMAPKFLGGDQPQINGQDRRQVLAGWLASPENPYFARNLANLVWTHFFGVGIIDPVDDVRISNPASNPQLLDELARRFTEYEYDFKRLVRDICTSRTYQLATATNDTNAMDGLNFSHARIRRMRAEVLLDAISQVTHTKNKFPGLPLGARAVQIADGKVSTYFLTTFGRAKRVTVCSCEVQMEPNLSQALHLINGDTVHQRIRDGGVVAGLLKAGRAPGEVVQELYVRCFSRQPTDAELARFNEAIEAEPQNKQQFLEDVFWAVLNSKEFIFNH